MTHGIPRSDSAESRPCRSSQAFLGDWQMTGQCCTDKKVRPPDDLALRSRQVSYLGRHCMVCMHLKGRHAMLSLVGTSLTGLQQQCGIL